MSGFKVELKGLNEVLKDLKNLPATISKEVTKELDIFGLNTVNDAKNFAPVDEGTLRNAISHKTNNLEVTITVNVDYAAYIEFGTRKFAAQYVASLPPDWQTFASQFKGGGAGGSFMSFFYTILKWVQRKGIAASYSVKSKNRVNNKTAIQNEYDAAYMIALKILREGIRPRPFLYPAVEKNRIELIKNLKALFK